MVAPFSSNPDDSPNNDSDGDGYTDIEETEAGFDPNDASDHPFIGDYPVNRCDPTPAGGGNVIGSPADDFTLTDQHGESISLSDFCGNVVVLESSQFN